MKRNFLITAVLSLVLMTSSFAQPGSMQGKMKKHQNLNKECMIPGITDSQKTKIKTLQVENMKAMENFHADLDIARAELKKLTIADKSDSKLIDKKIEAIGVIKTNMMKAQSHHRLAVRALLTDDQKVWFDQHSRKGMRMGHNNQGRMGRGHGDRMGRGCHRGQGMPNGMNK